jgi:tape measure domain-containing protein
MAPKTVQPIAIELGIKGGEKLAALNRSFRDLSKQVRLSDADISQATKDIIDFAVKAGNSEATIKGQIKAFEGLREQAALGGKAYIQLGKDIESLKVTLRGSTDEMEQQRAAFVKTGNAAKSSASDIAGVISQLENLRNKARPGSSAFAQLGKDIAALKSQLQEANVEVKKFNAGFEISQRPAMSLEKIQRQIGRLAEGLKSLNFISDEFLNVQERIALLSQVQGRTTARQQVRAQAQMYSSAAFATYAEGPAGSLSLPNTTAALQLEVTELQQRLINLDRSSSDYTATAMRLADAQRKLAQDVMGVSKAYGKLEAAEASAARRAGKVAGIQQYYAGGAGAPGVAGFRDPATGAIIARGAGNVADRRAFLAAQRQAGLSQYSAPISPELPEAIRKANEERKQEIRSRIENLKKINKENEALRERAAINRSIARGRARSIAQVAVEPPVREISGLYRQIGDIGMSKITASIELMGQSYSTVATDIKKATAASNGSIASLNRQRSAWSFLRDQLDPASKQFRDATKELEKVDRALSKVQRRRGLSPMQMTQAAGAAISGGIFGGPEGFLGGAIGAIGGVGTAFAGAAIGAQVGGLRRQLGDFADYAAGIQKLQIALRGAAGSQDEFNRAMAAASAATTQLNVPQDVAVRNMTRLTAAVKGAGGQVSDAEIVFRNVSSAIKATGGSAQDVDSAITAMVQVFSKGKVSAEELSGQLGERLPGAVTMFAEANKMTLPELQKALKDGTVGLNELMNFIIELGNKYDGTAKKIAGSSEEAGARLRVAYNQMRIDVGKALQPVGAKFQDAFAEFIKEITPALVVSLPKIAEAFAQIGRVVLDVSRAIGGAFAGMFAELQSQSETASANINSLFKGIGEFFSKTAKFMSQQWQFRIGEIIVNASGGNTQVKKIIESLGEFWKQTVDFMGRYWGKFVEYAVNAFAGALTGPVQVILQKAGINLGQVAASFVSGFGGGPSSPKSQKDEYSLPENVSDFPGPTPDSSSGGGGGKGMADKIRNAENGVLALRERLSRLIRDASFELDGLGVSAEDAIDNKFRQAMARAKDAQDDLLKKIKEFEATTGKTYDNLRKDAIRYGDILITVAEKQKNLELEELANKRFAALLKGYGFSGDVDVSGKMLGAMTPQEFPTGVDSILQPNQLKQNIEELRTSLQELVNPINQITSAATAIGDAFAQSFTSAISGASTAKEALASFFQSVGSYFLDMANQIIAKMITMAILNSVAKVLPGLGSNAGSGFNLTGFGSLQSDAGSGISGFMAGAGGILGRANGGPVNANQPYIVGERGPELFIPFQQGNITSNEELEAQMRETGSAPMAFTKAGADGKNGDDAISTSERRLLERSYADMLRETREERSYADRLRETESSARSFESMERSYADRLRETREIMLPFTRSSEQASMIAAERETAQAISNPGPIDVRYESQVINGVTYVTEEQHRKGMTQAAERGRALTLQALQNSVKTRSRVGI